MQSLEVLLYTCACCGNEIKMQLTNQQTVTTDMVKCPRCNKAILFKQKDQQREMIDCR